MIKEAIANLVTGSSLKTEVAAQVMQEIMEGEATPAQIGAFVTALRIKGETVEEIIGLAKTMKAKAVRVAIPEPVVDTCGTGGDGKGTFNISTCSAFVAAGAGLKVAKHGNRAMSSQCGSADVLEALGIKIDLDASQVERCLKEIGIGFMFAPNFHPAMKHAAVPRREIGIRTVFNILGPLTNPANARGQVLGVADEQLVEKLAMALQGLGCQHALVVHGVDGLDEITITGDTHISELKDKHIKRYVIKPEELGLPRAKLDDLKVSNLQENSEMLRNVLSGVQGPQRNIVLMNTAAVLMAGDKVETLQQGIAVAKESIDNGLAISKLEQLIQLSQTVAKNQ